MTKQPMIISPAENADFNNFMINYISMYNKYPDLTDVIIWIRNNVDPDEIYDRQLLEKY